MKEVHVHSVKPDEIEKHLDKVVALKLKACLQRHEDRVSLRRLRPAESWIMGCATSGASQRTASARTPASFSPSSCLPSPRLKLVLDDRIQQQLEKIVRALALHLEEPEQRGLCMQMALPSSIAFLRHQKRT